MNAKQVPESAVLAVLEELGWPDDREKSYADILFVRYWDIATDVVRAALNLAAFEPAADFMSAHKDGEKGITDLSDSPVTGDFISEQPLTEEEYQAWSTALRECRSENPMCESLAEKLRSEGRIQAARRLGILAGSPVWRLMTENQSSLDLPTNGEHIYRSTACLHGVHSYCQGLEGQCGEKIPGVCKFCRAGCICVCHTAEQPV